MNAPIMALMDVSRMFGNNLALDRARANGIALVFITHNATHALSVGDRYTVLIQGQVAAQFLRGDRQRDEVLNLMAGGEQYDAAGHGDRGMIDGA